MTNCRTSLFPAIVAIAMAIQVGCSGNNPPLGKVSGRVTLDGQPLAGVIINFKPTEGRAATGTTDADGNYTLEFSYGVMGAKLEPTRSCSNGHWKAAGRSRRTTEITTKEICGLEF